MILVDTDVLIAHLRGLPQARDWLLAARRRTELTISVLTVTEVTGGMRSAERLEVRTLLSALRPEPVTESVAHRAGELQRRWRSSHPGIGIADYVIAATAELHDLELATLNVKHFPMFPELTRPFDPSLTR